MSAFAPLLSLRLRHDFWGAAPPPIAVEPDDALRRLAAGPDILLRSERGGLHLHATGDWAQMGAEGLIVQMRLRAEDALVAAVTDALPDPRQGLPRLGPDVWEGEAGIRRLHQGARLGRSDIHLSDAASTEASDRMRPPLALVALRLPAPDMRPARFEIRFAASSRHWTYHVIGARNEKLSIRDAEDSVRFDDLGARSLSDGRAARAFRSTVPVPMRARPAPRFSLISESAFGPKVLLPALPAASAGMLHPDPDGAGPGADIFVNLS